MKLLIRALLIVALLAGAVVWRVRTSAPSGPRAWQPVAGGGEIRLYAITHGTQHNMSWGGPTWRQRMQTAWRSQSLTPLWSPSRGPSVSFGGAPSMCVWLETRGRPGGSLDVRDAILTLPDGQTFRSYGGGGSSGQNGGWLQHMNFSVLPARAPNLRFTAKLGSQPLDFSVPNPAYRTDLPAWKSAPLPQTVTQGKVALTLQALALKPDEGSRRPGAWQANPKWDISFDGQAARNWYRVGATYHDPAGNVLHGCGLLSEPTWKVHATLSRTNQYPFDESEVQWIGTIDPPSEAIQKPSFFALLPLDATAGLRGVVAAGVFGPGSYEMKDGVVAPTTKQPRRSVATNPDVEWDSQNKTTIWHTQRPFFVTAVEWQRGVLVFRDLAGKPVSLREPWSAGGPSRVTFHELPSAPVRFGVADPGALEFDFLVRPPELPVSEKGTAQP